MGINPKATEYASFTSPLTLLVKREKGPSRWSPIPAGNPPGVFLGMKKETRHDLLQRPF